MLQRGLKFEVSAKTLTGERQKAKGKKLELIAPLAETTFRNKPELLSVCYWYFHQEVFQPANVCQPGGPSVRFSIRVSELI